jgi:hypothetical protein
MGNEMDWSRGINRLSVFFAATWLAAICAIAMPVDQIEYAYIHYVKDSHEVEINDSTWLVVSGVPTKIQGGDVGEFPKFSPEQAQALQRARERLVADKVSDIYIFIILCLAPLLFFYALLRSLLWVGRGFRG